MGLLSNLAATYSSSYPYGSRYATSSGTDEMAIAVLVGTTVFSVIICLAVYVVTAIFMMKLFNKAKVAAWKAWVPFVNTWAFLQLGGQKGAWALGAILAIPIMVIVSIVIPIVTLAVAPTASDGSVAFTLIVVAILAYSIAYVGVLLTTVFQCIAAYNIGKKLTFDSAMVVLYIFVGIVWLGIAGLGKAKFDDKQGKPSLAPTVK
jgi:hypothetical protein